MSTNGSLSPEDFGVVEDSNIGRLAESISGIVRKRPTVSHSLLKASQNLLNTPGSRDIFPMPKGDLSTTPNFSVKLGWSQRL